MTPAELAAMQAHTEALAENTRMLSGRANPTLRGSLGNNDTVDIDKITRNLTGTIGGITKQLAESQAIWRTASDLGLSFGNDILGLSASIMQTRMSANEWGKAIAGAGNGLTALGGNMSASAKAFNVLSSQFSDTVFADQLRALGYTTAEYNEVLAVTLSGNKKLKLDDDRSKAEAFAAANRLAVELDAVAQLTGKSRQATLKEIEEQQKDGRVLAAIELAKLESGAKSGQVQAAQQEMFVSMQKLGMGKMANDIYAGGVMSETTRNQISGLGASGTELVNAIRSLKQASMYGTDAETQAAQARLKSVEASIAGTQMSKQYLTMVATGQGKFVEDARTLFSSAQAYRDGMTRMASDMGITVEAAQKLSAAEVKLYQEGKDAAGQATAGAKNTELAIKTQARINDSMVTLANILEASNNRLGRSAGVGLALNAVQNLQPNSSGVMTSSSARGGVLPESLTTLADEISRGAVMRSIPGIVGSAIKEGVKGLERMYLATKSIIISGEDLIPAEAEGSKDVFGGGNPGNWFHKSPGGEGEIVRAHEVEEAVVPKTKVPEFINDIFGGDFNKTLSGLVNSATPMAKNIQMPDMSAMFGDIFNNVKTQLESIKTMPAMAAVATAQDRTAPAFPQLALDDVKGELIQLNRTMEQVSNNILELVTNSDTQNRLVRRTSVNLNARG